MIPSEEHDSIHSTISIANGLPSSDNGDGETHPSLSNPKAELTSNLDGASVTSDPVALSLNSSTSSQETPSPVQTASSPNVDPLPMASVVSLNNSSSHSTTGSHSSTRPQAPTAVNSESCPPSNEPKVDPETRMNVALDAAQIGQFTRLREHVVEAVALPTMQEDEFYLKSGLQAQVQRSTMFRCIQEAAAMGVVKRRHKPHEIVTNDQPEQLDEIDETTASPVLTATELASRLVDEFVHQQHLEKAEYWSAEQTIERMEQQAVRGQAWKSNHVRLPTRKVPTFLRPVCYMTMGRQKDAVAKQAAEGGWERWDRLTQKRQLRIQSACRCVYCKDPSPVQTQSYQRLRMQRNWTDDSLREEERDIELSSHPRDSPTSQHQFDDTQPPPLTKPNDNRGPHMFNKPTTLASPTKHVKAWKARAAKAKREHQAKLELERQDSVGDVSLDSTSACMEDQSASKDSESVGPLPNLGRTQKRSNPSLSSFLAQGKPEWASRKLNKAPPLKDRAMKLDDSRHTPDWAGKDFLARSDEDSDIDDSQSCHTTGSWQGSKRQLRTARRRRRRPPHQAPRRIQSTDERPARPPPLLIRSRSAISLDGEIDEEELLRQELASVPW